MLMPGFGEGVLILGAIVLLFGGKKLPELGGAIGESIKNFKKGLSGVEGDKKKLESSENKSENKSEVKKDSQP